MPCESDRDYQLLSSHVGGPWTIRVLARVNAQRTRATLRKKRTTKVRPKLGCQTVPSIKLQPLLRSPPASSVQHGSQISQKPARHAPASTERPVAPPYSRARRPCTPRPIHARRVVPVVGSSPPPLPRRPPFVSPDQHREGRRVPCVVQSGTTCPVWQQRKPCYPARRRWIRPRLPEGSECAVSSLQEAQYEEAGDASFEVEGGDVVRVRLASQCPREKRIRRDRDLTGTGVGC
jgi:hypothetical protein